MEIYAGTVMIVSRFSATSLCLHWRRDGKGQESDREPTGWILLWFRYEMEKGNGRKG